MSPDIYARFTPARSGAPPDVDLAIPGVPAAKQRPRFSGGRTYTPQKTVNYETYLKGIFAEARPDGPLEGPLMVEFVFYMPEPKSMPKRDRGRQLPHTKRPDKDNLEKIVLDAGNGVLWIDDAQVYATLGIKVYGEAPRTEIRVWGLGETECL